MLKQVDFYILKQNNEQARRRFACRLINKAYRQKLRVFVQTANQAETALFDETLWTFDDISFIPHQTRQDFMSSEPVIISENPLQDRADIIINLSDRLLDNISSPRLLEIILSEPESTQLARHRYKTFQSQQIELNSHKIS